MLIKGRYLQGKQKTRNTTQNNLFPWMEGQPVTFPSSFLFQAVHGADHAWITHRGQKRFQEDPAEQPGWTDCPGHRRLPQAVLLLYAPAQHQRWASCWGGEGKGSQEREQLRLLGQKLQTWDHQPKGARFATKDKRHTFQQILRKARLSPALVSQLNLGDICGQFFVKSLVKADHKQVTHRCT